MLPTTPDMSQVWDHQYSMLLEQQRRWPAEELAQFIHGKYRSLGAVKALSHQRVFELGCGLGGNLVFLATSGFQVAGIDLAPSAAGITLMRLKNVVAADRIVRISAGDVRQATLGFGGAGLPYETDGPYHGIIDIRSGQHFTWHDHVLLYRHYTQLLLPGGWLFSIHLTQDTYDRALYRDLVLPDLYTIASNNHQDALFRGCGLLCLPTCYALEDRIGEAGLQVISHEEVHRSYRRRAKWAVYSIIVARKPDKEE